MTPDLSTLNTLRGTTAPRNSRNAAFSLVETMVAVALSCMTLGTVMILNAQQLKLVKSSRESNAASLVLQDRVEQMRILTWNNLTNPAYVKDCFLATPPPSAKQLAHYTERLTVSQWPPTESLSGNMIVETQLNGAPLVLMSGAGMADRKQAKVDLLVTWQGKDRGQRQRSYSTIISNSGVTRTNLPGFGGPTGAPPPTPQATPPPGGTPFPVFATPTPTPSTGNGNRFGRGNAGGKNGKG